MQQWGEESGQRGQLERGEGRGVESRTWSKMLSGEWTGEPEERGGEGMREG